MAVIHGLDPVEFGRYDGDELTWAVAALNEAEELRAERTRALIQNLGIIVGNEVAKRIREIFR